MQTDGSSSLAPDRSTSLQSQSRPVTSGPSCYHLSTTLPSSINTRSNRSSYHPPSTYHNHEWDMLKQRETSQLTVPDDGRLYAIPFSQFGPTTPRSQRTHVRRGSISESIKNGFSSVRSLGRRMSSSMKNKRSNTTDDRLLVPDMITPTDRGDVLLSERSETNSSSSSRPKSIVQGLRARRRPSMPIIKYGPRVDEAQSQAVSRTDSCRTESFHRAATIPQRPEYLGGGAGARASAAAQNEALQLARATPLPPYRPRSGSFEEYSEYRDSESGIGIMLYGDERSESRSNSVFRYDPAAVLATELLEHVMSFLDAPSLMDLELVSRRWRELCQSQTVWRQVFYREYAPSVSSRILGAPKIAGLGKNTFGQNYRRLYSIRKLIDKRWENGEAAAIYLNGHKDSVYCVQFDEDKIITGSRDNTIRIWDARTYRCIGKLGPPNNPRERNHIIRGDCDPTGVVPFFKMDVQSVDPKPRSKPPAIWHQASVLCLQYDSDLLVTGSSDFTAIVWSIKHDYKPIFRLTGHKAGILDVALDSKRIITCSKDTTIKIWSRRTGVLMSTLKGHRGPVNAVQVRNNLLASASGDGMAKLWRLDTGMCIKEFHSRERGLACVEFSEDGRTIFAGGNDHVVYEYDTTTANVKRELRGHSELVRSLHLDSANGRIISGSYDHSIKVWNSKTGTSEEDGGLKLNLGGLTSSWMLAAKSNYRKIACASQDGRIVIIDFGFGINGVDLVEA